jgi:hypothetical protein
MNRKTSPTFTLLMFTLALAGSAGVTGCAVAADGADETGRESSPVRGGLPPDPAGLVTPASSSPDPDGSCKTNADCPGTCAGVEVVCCPVCGEEGYCGVACEPSGSHPPPSTRLRPDAFAR